VTRGRGVAATGVDATGVGVTIGSDASAECGAGAINQMRASANGNRRRDTATLRMLTSTTLGGDLDDVVKLNT
jgi:hypothetical protein